MTDKKNDSLMVTPGNAQHIGSRGEQQDSFGFSHFDDPEFVAHGGVLAVVADGMGGLALGKESSTIAVQIFLAVYAAKKPNEAIADVLDRGLHAANSAVNKRAAEAGVAGEAGTTIVAVVIHDGKLYRISAGDSRIYLFRQGTLTQITTDYNYGRVLDRMVANGEIGSEAAAAHPSRAALTSYLGKSEVDDYDQPSDQPMELVSGDKVLLASDGLFGFLPEIDIARLLILEPQQAAEALIQETIALQSPYQDNVTVAVLGYDLPPVKSLSSTVMRLEEPTGASVATSTKKKTSQGYWLKIAAVILVLAVVGFFGGRYLGSQGLVPASPKAVEKTSAESTLKMIMTCV